MGILIHINQHIIRARNGEPPITVIHNSRTRTRHHEVEIIGPARVVYRPDKPLKCGARVWIEAEGIVT